MSPETEGKEPAPIFDVRRIAKKMEGWQLKQPAPKSESWFILTRQTTDGRHLILGMNPLRGYVSFKEREGPASEICFRISCRNIKAVDFSDDDIAFRGNVEYKISSGGAFHDVRLLDSQPEDVPITSRTYEF